MRGLERALELLRPFVDSRNWAYCVVWKLGDDSSRLIEWMGCCCSGGSNGSCEEKNRNQSVPLCRDLYFAHKMNSKTCEALAAFPLFLPLCSEIYGDVVNSNQSKWIVSSAPIDSNSSTESLGTRVLIPVLGGLIELFSAKHIVKDQKIIDFIIAHCNVPKQEGTVDYCHPSLDQLVELNPNNFQSQSYLLSLLCGINMVRPLTRCSANSSLQGSSGSLDPSNDYQSLVSHCDYFAHSGISNSLQKPPDPKKSKDKNFLKNQGCQVLSKGIHKPEFRSKNLITERNRRNRINDGIFTLRSLVPKITKMNKVATLGDAIKYIRELESEFKDLQDELTELEKEQEQEFKDSNTELLTSDKKNSPSEIKQGSPSVRQKKRIETEVNQLGKKEFLIKVFSEKEQGGFRRLIDLVYSMGLQVANVNMTTHDGHVSTFLTVEAISRDIQLKRLRESLLKLGV